MEASIFVGREGEAIYIVQAKRYLKTSVSGLLTAARKEAKAWASRDILNVYWFVTSLE